MSESVTESRSGIGGLGRRRDLGERSVSHSFHAAFFRWIMMLIRIFKFLNAGNWSWEWPNDDGVLASKPCHGGTKRPTYACAAASSGHGTRAIQYH